jgi:UDP-N-acetylglucosamine 2-epimerase (non-hydrolysing)
MPNRPHNTERPVTMTIKTTILIGQDMDRLKLEVAKILSGNSKTGTIPSLWDGKGGDASQ